MILLVYLIGFGIPRSSSRACPPTPWCSAASRSRCPTAPTSPRCTGPGSISVHRGQRDAALAIGLTEGQALRYVILPQAVRRVGPPLLNDFISLQKDVALISILGPQEAFRIAQIDASSTFNYTPLIAAALLYLCVTVPLARVVDRIGLGLGGEARYGRAASRCSRSARSRRRSASARCCTASTSRCASTRPSP